VLGDRVVSVTPLSLDLTSRVDVETVVPLLGTEVTGSLPMLWRVLLASSSPEFDACPHPAGRYPRGGAGDTA
jgi:hypothetical protein